MAETGFKVFRRGVPKESSTIGPLEHLDPAYSKTKILGLVFFHFSTFWNHPTLFFYGMTVFPVKMGQEVFQLAQGSKWARCPIVLDFPQIYSLYIFLLCNLNSNGQESLY